MSSAWLRAGVRTKRTARTATPANLSATKPMAPSCLAEVPIECSGHHGGPARQIITGTRCVGSIERWAISARRRRELSVQDAVENVVHAELVRLVRRVDGKHAGRRPL